MVLGTLFLLGAQPRGGITPIESMSGVASPGVGGWDALIVIVKARSAVRSSGSENRRKEITSSSPIGSCAGLAAASKQRT
jgi:hypothetical protein